MKSVKQHWRTVNLIPLSVNIQAGKSKLPLHFFVLTRKGLTYGKLPFTNWVEGCCNSDMQVVAYCRMTK